LQARAMLIHCFQIASATYLPLYPDHTSLHVKELFPPPWPSCLQLRARRRRAFASPASFLYLIRSFAANCLPQTPPPPFRPPRIKKKGLQCV
jgi:hypothetical protein